MIKYQKPTGIAILVVLSPSIFYEIITGIHNSFDISRDQIYIDSSLKRKKQKEIFWIQFTERSPGLLLRSVGHLPLPFSP